MGVTPTTSSYTRTYTSFSGIDIKAIFHNKVLGELQGISYSVTREKAPIYTVGSPDPRSFSRGKRGIAGSMIFTVFDRHAIDRLMLESLYLAKRDELKRPESFQTWRPSAIAVHEVDNTDMFDNVYRTPLYADQIPPFDITLTAMNEYGNGATMKLFGVEILNEGAGMSIDDIVNETQMTYVCRTLFPWQPIEGHPDIPIPTTAS